MQALRSYRQFRVALCVGLVPLTFPLGFSNALPSTPGSSLRAGNATSSQSERNDTCILGRMTPSTARTALVGVARCGQFARNLQDQTTTLTLASVLLLVLSLFGRAARNHRHF